MPCTQLILLGRLSLSDKVAQGFGIFIGNPNCSQISGTVAACQLYRVSPVGLYTISRLLRNQARRHHHTVDSQLRQLPIKYEACRPSFVASAQLLRWTKLLDELANRIFTVGDRAQAAYLNHRLRLSL